jgi:hypothetical protein
VRRRGAHGKRPELEFTESYKKRSLLDAATFASPSSGWNLSSVPGIVKADSFCRPVQVLANCFRLNLHLPDAKQGREQRHLSPSPVFGPKRLPFLPLIPVVFFSQGSTNSLVHRAAQNLIAQSTGATKW